MNTPEFMKPTLPTRQEIECEICHLQKRIVEGDGLYSVLEYRLQQQRKLLEMMQ